MKYIKMSLVTTLLLAGSMHLNAQMQSPENPHQSFVEKMRGLVESQKKHKNILLVDQSDMQVRERKELIDQAGRAAGSITALVVLLSVLERPTTFGDVVWKSLQLVFGVWVVGGLLSEVYKPVIRFFVSAFYRFLDHSIVEEQQTSLHQDVLTEFVKNWHELKPHVPVSLHQQCDALHLLYLEQGAQLTLTQDQAAYLINGIILSCINDHTHMLNEKVA